MTSNRRISFHLMTAAALLCAHTDLHAQVKPTTGEKPGPVKAQHLTAELVPSAPGISPGGIMQIGLKLSLEPGWHVYWKNAGDSGKPPSLEWTLPKRLDAGPMQFPIPTRLPLGSLVDFGYEGIVIFPFQFKAAPDLRPGHVPVGATVTWLVCREVCIPGRAQLNLDLKVAHGAGQGQPSGELAEALATLPKTLPTALQISVAGDEKDFLLTLHGTARSGSPEFYPSDPDEIANAATQANEAIPGGFRMRIERAPALAKRPDRLRGVLKLSSNQAYEIDAPILPDQLVAASEVPHREDKMTALAAVGLAFLGGILLNLMPCVFPVLFLKGLALVQSSKEDRKELRSHGLMYSAGILLSFWVIVAVLLVFRSMGNQAGWGFQLQSPVFIGILASFLFFLALSLAGQFDVGLSITAKGGSFAQKQGYAGSFFTGVLAAVVAAPCMGPFLGAAVGFALAQPAWITFAVFTAMALGLAFPYMLLTAQPVWMRVLPRPGAWMETFKQLTAVPIFATVIWLTWVYTRLFASGPDGPSDHVARLLLSFLVLAIAGWTLGRWPARWLSTGVACALWVAVLVILMVKPGRETLQWQPFTESALDSARNEHRPIFIDFTAAWCLSCQFNEKTVLHSDEVARQLGSHQFVLLKADWTGYDANITTRLALVGRSGVPTYVVYPAEKNSTADVLPEVLTKSAVLEAIRRDTR